MTLHAVAFLGVASAVLASAADATAADISPAATDHLGAAQRQLARARVQQKFAVAERGNVLEFESALRSLAGAEQEALQARSAGPKTWPELTATTADIRAERAQIDQLRQTAESWFSGRFPLVRGLGLSNLESDEEPLVIFGQNGRAQRAALRAALAKNSQLSLPGDMLFAAVIVLPDGRSQAQDAELAELAEIETTLAFNSMPNVTFCPGAWQKLPAAPAWNAADNAFVPHCRELLTLCGSPAQPQNLLFFIVREMDPGSTQDHWIEVQRRVFYAAAIAPLLVTPPGTALEAAQVRISEGLCRDRRELAPTIVTFGVTLAALAVAFYVVALALGRHIVGSWQAWVLPPLGGFAIGLAVPLMSLRVVQSIAPPPNAAAIDSAWWPALAGMLALILPAVVLRLGVKRAQGVLGDWQIEGRWGLAMVSVALGVCAFWCWPASVSLGSQAIAVLIPLVVASALVLFLFGRAIDTADRLPVALAAVAALVALPLGLGEFLASPAVLWGVAVVAGAIVFGAETATRARVTKRTRRTTPRLPPNAAHASDGPETLAGLRAQALSPAYQPLGAFAAATAPLARFAAGRTVWLALCGTTGAGKTVTAQHLIAQLNADDPALEVLIGHCRSGGSPYEPFHESLAAVCGAIAPGAGQPQNARLDSMLRGLVGMFVPFYAILADAGQTAGASAATPSDLMAAVSGALRKLTRDRHVVLFIDNVQWLDEGSATLLEHLRERLPPEGELPLMILLAGRDDTRLRSLGLEAGIIRVPVPSTAEQQTILTGSLRIDPDSARHILDAMGALAEEPGGLFWLGRAVVELVDAGAFELTGKGFALRADFLATRELPVPADLRSELATRLRGSSQDQAVAECAALLGARFRVSDLADSLAIDRLELLRTLHRFERELRICRDVVDDDDLYAFSSAFMLEVVRAEFGIVPLDRPGQKPAKIVQELHARIAATLERRVRKDPSLLYALAEHYHGAGDRYAGQSVEYGLLAARAARGQFAYENARNRLRQIDSAARLLERTPELARQSLLIDCDEANVTGRNRLAVAARGIDHLSGLSSPDHELTICVARACYDAGRDSGQPHWFDQAVRLARETIENSGSIAEQAEGYHLLGISLPTSQSAERLEYLRRGLALLDPPEFGGATDRLLQARLLDSLAEQLSHGKPSEQLEARSLFERSLSLRRTQVLGDLPGQARGLGGLGRLSYSGDPPDYAQAARYFQEDLAISQEIGDAAGESLCHSFLGRCDRAVGQLTAALGHFRQAAKVAPSTKDRLFAYAGMLDVSIELDQLAEAELIGRELLAEIDSNPLPDVCAAEIARVLSIHSARLRGDWAQSLADRLAAS